MPGSPRLLIADDEPALADNLVAELAALWREATLSPAVHDGQSVLDIIDDAAEGQGPDVVFLGIRMPGLSGIDVARELSDREERPLVVFVTAYDQSALDAFEQAAVDYVLKPVQTERLAETVKRLKDRLGTRPNGNAAADPATTLAELVEGLAGLQGAAQMRVSPQGGYLSFIKALVGQEVRFIPVDDALYPEATDKYVNVVAGSGEPLIRTSLRDLLTQIDPEHFWAGALGDGGQRGACIERRASGTAPPGPEDMRAHRDAASRPAVRAPVPADVVPMVRVRSQRLPL